MGISFATLAWFIAFSYNGWQVASYVSSLSNDQISNYSFPYGTV